MRDAEPSALRRLVSFTASHGDDNSFCLLIKASTLQGNGLWLEIMLVESGYHIAEVPLNSSKERHTYWTLTVEFQKFASAMVTLVSLHTSSSHIGARIQVDNRMHLILSMFFGSMEFRALALLRMILVCRRCDMVMNSMCSVHVSVKVG